MNTGFSFIDYAIFIAYGLLIIAVGLWVSRTKKGTSKTAKDYFLASKALPWWAIGASLIAANISAEQFIGMSGSGFAIGLGIASYEWMAAITLILVGKFFLPVFLEKKIYTIPQFLEKRYDNRVRTILAVFWILTYIFINLTSVLYLGALALKTILDVPLIYGILGLALFAVVYSIYGGLSAVAWTDVIQVIFLIGGGLLTTYIALDAVGGDSGAWQGAKELLHSASDRFDMILNKEHPFYSKLPGIGVLLGGMWVANLYYWGFNQYIIQRALAAKSIKEAQRGVIFAGYLKILLPCIVVIPGIAAYVIVGNPDLLSHLGNGASQHIPTMAHADKAYPWLLSLLPYGFKGLAFAALTAAIVSSLASMLNSTSTIFTMDIYNQFSKQKLDDKKQVTIGRITAIVALTIAILVAPQLNNLDQAFQYIQEYTGMVSPGILAIFLLGLFWRKTTANAALCGAIITLPVAIFFKFTFPQMPFLDQMGYSFLAVAVIMLVVTKLQSNKPDAKGIKISGNLFKTDNKFNVGAVGVTIIVAVLYILFW